MMKADGSAREDSLRTSRERALSLTQRSPSTRQFLLNPSNASTDINHLLTHRPAFIISTHEEQSGALSGNIALNYLLIPSFCNQNGLSGGLVATTYTKRTHPLHAPTVMAHVRLGRYLKDDNTGEWTFLTRNTIDGLTRVQYVRINGLQRERIGTTCVSKLFDEGDYHNSVLFQCHDRQWRACPLCEAPPHAKCGCLDSLRKFQKSRFVPITENGNNPARFSQLTEMVLSEGDAQWQGHVRVTVLTGLSNSKSPNIDEFMNVYSTVRASPDPVLIAEIKRLAIRERIREFACVPPLLQSKSDDENEKDDDERKQKQELTNQKIRKESQVRKVLRQSSAYQCLSDDDPAISSILPDAFSVQDPLEETENQLNNPSSSAIEGDAAYEADRENEDRNQIERDHRYGFNVVDEDETNQTEHQKSKQTTMKEEPYLEPVVPQADCYPAFTPEDLDEMFNKSTNERANHFLIPNTNLEEILDECAMLPADPSTLPGGTELCLDGMVIDDDWCSRMTSDVDGNSASSTLSTTGSDCAPKPESVPLPEFETLSSPDSLTEMDYASSFPPPSKLELPPQMRSVMDKEKQFHSKDDKLVRKPTQGHTQTIYRNLESNHRAVPVPNQECQPKTQSNIQKPTKKSTKQPPRLARTKPIVSSKQQQKQDSSTTPAFTDMNPMISSGFHSAPSTQIGTVPIQQNSTMTGGLYMPMMSMPMIGASNGLMPSTVHPQASSLPPGAIPMMTLPHGVRLAPRPAGMSMQEATIWELGAAYNGNRIAIAAKMNAIEKERKAEERRKKNRQAAARSNARKKNIMDGIKAQIKETLDQVDALREKERFLKDQNRQLKKRLDPVH